MFLLRFCAVTATLVATGVGPLLAQGGDGSPPVGPDDTSPSSSVLPLHFQVANLEGDRVIGATWIEQQVRWANRIFARAHLAFRVAAVEDLDSAHTRLETRRDRHALGARVRAGVVNCFIVQSLRDVDDRDRYRMGVHWRPRGYPNRHLVIVSSSAAPTVLAHELGHFFGNRRHPETPGNIMSYNRGSGIPFFDDVQSVRIQRFAQRFLRSGELKAVSEPASD